ncbi:hypothetical protein GT755_19820 [Herbidospora sp. NEAU-GS84]|uniref:Uncharacterized protein n=1 Tax=Herbidospora solisilvae TaxID=2696284 RepID=A0A7C9J9U0_9ACTN|nr:hypothetical protein [Herbidospora solisilvae]NAS23928.1 hypothetical protein [Herbidospora solisilvae]
MNGKRIARWSAGVLGGSAILLAPVSPAMAAQQAAAGVSTSPASTAQYAASASTMTPTNPSPAKKDPPHKKKDKKKGKWNKHGKKGKWEKHTKKKYKKHDKWDKHGKKKNKTETYVNIV